MGGLPSTETVIDSAILAKIRDAVIRRGRRRVLFEIGSHGFLLVRRLRVDVAEAAARGKVIVGIVSCAFGVVDCRAGVNLSSTYTGHVGTIVGPAGREDGAIIS